MRVFLLPIFWEISVLVATSSKKIISFSYWSRFDSEVIIEVNIDRFVDFWSFSLEFLSYKFF